jgi:hypothetical protein
MVVEVGAPLLLEVEEEPTTVVEGIPPRTKTDTATAMEEVEVVVCPITPTDSSSMTISRARRLTTLISSKRSGKEETLMRVAGAPRRGSAASTQTMRLEAARVVSKPMATAVVTEVSTEEEVANTDSRSPSMVVREAARAITSTEVAANSPGADTINKDSPMAHKVEIAATGAAAEVITSSIRSRMIQEQVAASKSLMEAEEEEVLPGELIRAPGAEAEVAASVEVDMEAAEVALAEVEEVSEAVEAVADSEEAGAIREVLEVEATASLLMVAEDFVLKDLAEMADSAVNPTVVRVVAKANRTITTEVEMETPKLMVGNSFRRPL